eukprot:403360821
MLVISLLALYFLLYYGLKGFIGLDNNQLDQQNKPIDPNQVQQMVQEDKYANLSVEEMRKLPEIKSGLPLFTVEELSQYTGTNPKLYVAIKSVIFDVSANPVYQHNGGYHMFTGKDSSVALARMDHKDEFFDRENLHWSKVLTKEELKVMMDWADFFEKRYGIVGYLKEDIEMLSENGKKDL